MTGTDYSQWQPGWTEEPRDQQKDLADGYWAEVGPNEPYSPWAWSVLIGTESEVVAEGPAGTEAAAKRAVDVWETAWTALSKKEPEWADLEQYGIPEYHTAKTGENGES